MRQVKKFNSTPGQGFREIEVGIHTTDVVLLIATSEEDLAVDRKIDRVFLTTTGNSPDHKMPGAGEAVVTHVSKPISTEIIIKAVL